MKTIKKIDIQPIAETDMDFIFDNWIGQDEMVGMRALNSLTEKREILQLIATWKTKTHNGRYFEVFKIIADMAIVGLLSLYEVSEKVISIGCTVSRSNWSKGYGSGAVMCAIKKAKEKGWLLISTQCIAENISSIKLHEKCGFKFIECKNNKEGNLCNFYELGL